MKNEFITKCPFCAEEIQLEAKKCKHCGEWVNKESPQVEPLLISTQNQTSETLKNVLNSQQPPRYPNTNKDKKQNDLKYYTLSGKFSISGLIYPILFGIIASIISSIIYGYIVRVPNIWLKLIIISLYGGMVGAAVAEGCKKGKIRNVNVTGFLAFVIGIFAVFCSWVSWLYFIENKRPSGGELFWFIEAIIIVVASIWYSRNLISESIFCETCQNLVKENGFKVEVEEINNLNEFKKQLGDNIYKTVNSLKRKDENDNKNYSELELKKCEACNNLNLLTIKSIKVKVKKGKKAKPEKDTKTVIDRLLLEKDTYEWLIKDFEDNNKLNPDM